MIERQAERDHLPLDRAGFFTSAGVSKRDRFELRLVFSKPPVLRWFEVRRNALCLVTLEAHGVDCESHAAARRDVRASRGGKSAVESATPLSIASASTSDCRQRGIELVARQP